MVVDSEIKPPPAEVSRVVDHLFRHESGRMIGTLIRIFGSEHWALAEDVVQETLFRALQTWPFRGVPQNPSAWLMRVARNLALDVLRRETLFRRKEPEIIQDNDAGTALAETATFSDEEIADDQLRLMFVCCHPVIPPESQIVLALKTLCGFSPAEIASAFLSTEAAIAKSLTRAKQRIGEAGVSFEIPSGPELSERLDAVLKALYLLFNEGYKASSGDQLVRREVCDEAIRLVNVLAGHPCGNQPGTHALLALMTLSAARFPARVDPEGNLLRLEDQDRSLWDRALIGKGMLHLAQLILRNGASWRTGSSWLIQCRLEHGTLPACVLAVQRGGLRAFWERSLYVICGRLRRRAGWARIRCPSRELRQSVAQPRAPTQSLSCGS